MFNNIFYNTKNDVIHLWESVRGETIYNEIDWVPYVFAKSSKGSVQTIDGYPVTKRPFQSYRDYYTFCKDNHRIFENKVRPEIQFLAERYHGIPDDELEIPKLLIYHIDIEVHSEFGFPDPNEAKDPIVLISLRNNMTDRTITFGEREYTGDAKGTTYFWCKNEEELLTKFFKYMHKNPADVISGWYIWNFDLPYIINRSKKIFGQNSDIYNFMSPIRIVRTWRSKKYNEMNIDIAGVTILDYHHLYKWYTPHNLESYTLDFVSNFELGEGKLDYSEYKDLKELYKKNWNKYVEYNVVDCLRVDQLEKKLKYIELVQSLSLLTKCPMKYYNSMTVLIEGAMLTFFRRNGLCAPYFAGGTQEYFPAAYVKEPQKGMYDWICDLDIASSYPSHIIALNMSVETYIGRIMGIRDDEMVYHTRSREYPPFDMMKDSGFTKFDGNRLDSFNKALERGLVAIAPCGSVFSTSEPGVIASVEREIFSKRKEVQKKRKEIRDVMPESERVDQLFSLQHALKIITNAVFGILAVPYSRYFNVNMAEAVTSCGKHTIKQGEKFVNEYYHSKNIIGIPDDLVCYIDTDSLFIRLGDYFSVIDKQWDTKTPDEKVKSIITESKNLVGYINDRIYNETQLLDYNSQDENSKIEFEQEIIARTALFVKKKKYAYWCVDDGGTSVDAIKVTGLEIVRSDSSEAVRTRLKVVMEMIMRKHSDDEITKVINKYKKELEDVLPEEIAANIGINNIDKYIVDGRSTKGTPWHIKGVANYRILLKEYNIEDKYEDIYEGLKAKVVYVKKNRFGMETITFQRWPKEFDIDIEIDYQTMVQKFFLKKIGFLLDPMNKKQLLEDGMVEEVINAFFV